MSLTPPQWIEVHRYWGKVAQIQQHLRAPGGCRCGNKYDEDPLWAQHLADVLFPHAVAHQVQPERS